MPSAPSTTANLKDVVYFVLIYICTSNTSLYWFICPTNSSTWKINAKFSLITSKAHFCDGLAPSWLPLTTSQPVLEYSFKLSVPKGCVQTLEMRLGEILSKKSPNSNWITPSPKIKQPFLPKTAYLQCKIHLGFLKTFSTQIFGHDGSAGRNEGHRGVQRWKVVTFFTHNSSVQVL